MVIQLPERELWKGEALMSSLYDQPEMDGNFDASYWRETWSRMIRSGNGVLFGYTLAEGVVVSLLGASAFKHINTGEPQASVITGYTLPKFRKLGLSTKLLQAFGRWAADKGCRVAYTNYLTVRENFKPVARVFSREGYKLHEQVYKKDLK